MSQQMPVWDIHYPISSVHFALCMGKWELNIRQAML